MKSSYIILPAALFIISCNSSPKKPDVVEHFVTHITEDGTKQFNYTLVISSQNNERHKSGGRNGNNGGSGEQRGKGGQGRNRRDSRNDNGQSDQAFKMKERVLQKLERALFEKSYCHEGYIKLETFFDREMSAFRGKCKEIASQDDKDKFQNQ